MKDRGTGLDVEGFQLGSLQVSVIPERGTLALLSLAALILVEALGRPNLGE